MDNPFNTHDDDQVNNPNPGADNKVHGKMDELGGKVEKAAGNLVNDRGMQAKGEMKEVKGKAEQGAGTVENKVDDLRDNDLRDNDLRED
ncbi:MAG TPA: CsbD family protein [Ktedonobacterales bacterium]